MSMLGGALAAAYAQLPLGHVEAGLRSGDHAARLPEELHRRPVTPAATLHFAPTESAGSALQREGVPAEAIHVTGNTGIDALPAATQSHHPAQAACP
jgi:UDP-N-acetylglucosamine 2-epimerase (non-hydrolysing)